jgi:hypothetical protein
LIILAAMKSSVMVVGYRLSVSGCRLRQPSTVYRELSTITL